MKILVVSDTHGHDSRLFDVLEKEKPIDMFIHCGDMEDVGSFIADFTDCPVVLVRGNCDYGRVPDKYEEIVQAGSHKIYVVHGHEHNVKNGVEMLAATAQSRGADVALYGHTHIPEVDELYGVYIMNPGSLGLPRQESRKPTYGLIHTKPDGSIYMETKILK